MNVKKIIKGVFGLGAVAGIAYAAFKLGESNGEINERFRERSRRTMIISSTTITMSLTMSALPL